MEIHTYRARSLHDALRMLREDIGADPQVVNSRELETGWLSRIACGREFEIRTRRQRAEQTVAQAEASSSRRVAQRPSVLGGGNLHEAEAPSFSTADGFVSEPDAPKSRHSGVQGRPQPEAHESRQQSPKPFVRPEVRTIELGEATLGLQQIRGERTQQDRLEDTAPTVTDAIDGNETRGHSLASSSHDFDSTLSRDQAVAPPVLSHVGGASSLFEVLADLVDAEIPDAVARELLDAVTVDGEHESVDVLQERLLRTLSKMVVTTGPIRLTNGQQKVMALVGPTGVGKTTTIAKLAANLRLCEQRRVGLITVDTYRIAAVDQLRTYAEIMDLPMEVVASPGDMRKALTRLSDEDVILIDTSGRSPQDSVQLHQLKSTLLEASPHEVQLVLSCTGSARHLKQVVERFSPIGCTSLLVTKLDEATSLGNLVPLVKQAGLPFSYLTCGQSVPDDIVVAEKSSLVPAMLGQAPIASLV